MKYLLPLLLLFTVSCQAQKFDPAPPVIIDAPFEVISITDNNMVIQSKLTRVRINVDPKPVEIDKVYWFWVSVAPCDSCKTATGVILDYHISPDQANRDIKEKDRIIREQSL